MNILEEAKQLGFSPYDGDTKGCFAGLTILSVDVQLRIVDSVEVWRVWICDSESSVLLEHEFESCETAMFAASTLLSIASLRKRIARVIRERSIAGQLRENENLSVQDRSLLSQLADMIERGEL